MKRLPVRRRVSPLAGRKASVILGVFACGLAGLPIGEPLGEPLVQPLDKPLGKPLVARAAQSAETTLGVTVVREAGRYRLQVDGEPFEIRGAGLEGPDAEAIDVLAGELSRAGGNTFRTWGTRDIDAQLAAAERHDLRVLVGLDVAQELSGFDYSDTAAVRRQHQANVRIIDRYGAHPRVLGWLVGNEPNLLVADDGQLLEADPRVYDAIDDLVTYIKTQSPARPTTVAFAFTPTLDKDVQTALTRIASLDVVSFQGYGALPAIPDVVERLELDRPFMITEYGALGHWEMPTTAWGREIEEPSGIKAAGVVARRQTSIENDRTGRLLGAFAFLWGQKQERTPTWYGLFANGGERTTLVGELQKAWTGKWPANRAPGAQAIELDGRVATDSIVLDADFDTAARVTVIDPESDPLKTRWELRTEVIERSAGGHAEQTPPALPLVDPVESTFDDGAGLQFRTPSAAGEYRLFAWTSDGQGGVATANIPFRVQRAAP